MVYVSQPSSGLARCSFCTFAAVVLFFLPTHSQQDEAIGCSEGPDWATLAPTLRSEVVCAWSEDRYVSSNWMLGAEHPPFAQPTRLTFLLPPPSKHTHTHLNHRETPATHPGQLCLISVAHWEASASAGPKQHQQHKREQRQRSP